MHGDASALVVNVCDKVLRCGYQQISYLEENVLCAVIHMVYGAQRSMLCLYDLESREISPGIFLFGIGLGSETEREEYLTATQSSRCFGCVISLKFHQGYCVRTETILLQEERHQYAIHHQDDVVGIGTVPYIVSKAERDLAFHTMRAGD